MWRPMRATDRGDGVCYKDRCFSMFRITLLRNPTSIARQPLPATVLCHALHAFGTSTCPARKRDSPTLSPLPATVSWFVRPPFLMLSFVPLSFSLSERFPSSAPARHCPSGLGMVWTTDKSEADSMIGLKRTMTHRRTDKHLESFAEMDFVMLTDSEKRKKKKKKRGRRRKRKK